MIHQLLNPALLEATSTIASATSGPPGAGVIADGVTLAALLAGIAMWLFGARLVRPLQALLFGAIGALIGYLTPTLLALDLNPLFTLGAGAFLGALLGIATFRITMAITLAAMLGLVFPLAASVALRANPTFLASEESGPLTPEEQLLPDVPIDQGGDGDSGSGDPGVAAFDGTIFDLVYPGAAEQKGAADLAIDLELTDEQKEALRHRAEQLRRFLGALSSEMRAEWASLPRAHQIILALSAALGAVIGLLAGLSKPKKVAAVTTAFLGAAAFLSAGSLLVRTHSPDMAASLPAAAAAWVLIWLLLSATGALLQWTALRPKADKKSRD